MVDKSSVLKNLKVILQIPETDTSRDPILDIYVQSGLDYIKGVLGYKSDSEIPELLSSATLDIAVFYYNQNGFEGFTNKSEGKMSYNVAASLPQHILDKLNKHRRLSVR